MDKAEFFASLDKMGEAVVRQKLAIDAWGVNEAVWVAEWLGPRDDARQTAMDAQQARAVKAAERANFVSALALILAALSLIVSLVKS